MSRVPKKLDLGHTPTRREVMDWLEENDRSVTQDPISGHSKFDPVTRLSVTKPAENEVVVDGSSAPTQKEVLATELARLASQDIESADSEDSNSDQQ